VIDLQFFVSSIERLPGCEAFALEALALTDAFDQLCKRHLAAIATVGSADGAAND
jgi:hypothetical protein